MFRKPVRTYERKRSGDRVRWQPSSVTHTIVREDAPPRGQTEATRTTDPRIFLDDDSDYDPFDTTFDRIARESQSRAQPVPPSRASDSSYSDSSDASLNEGRNDAALPAFDPFVSLEAVEHPAKKPGQKRRRLDLEPMTTTTTTTTGKIAKQRGTRGRGRGARKSKDENAEPNLEASNAPSKKQPARKSSDKKAPEKKIVRVPRKRKGRADSPLVKRCSVNLERVSVGSLGDSLVESKVEEPLGGSRLAASQVQRKNPVVALSRLSLAKPASDFSSSTPIHRYTREKTALRLSPIMIDEDREDDSRNVNRDVASLRSGAGRVSAGPSSSTGKTSVEEKKEKGRKRSVRILGVTPDPEASELLFDDTENLNAETRSVRESGSSSGHEELPGSPGKSSDRESLKVTYVDDDENARDANGDPSTGSQTREASRGRYSSSRQSRSTGEWSTVSESLEVGGGITEMAHFEPLTSGENYSNVEIDEFTETPDRPRRVTKTSELQPVVLLARLTIGKVGKIFTGMEESSSRNIDGEPSSRNIDGEPSSRNIDEEPYLRNIDEPSARNIDEEPSLRNIDEPSSRSIDGESSSRNIDGEPSSRNIDGEPSSRNIDGEPSSRNIDGEPSSRNIDEPSSRNIDGEPSSRNIDGEPSSRNIDEPSSRNIDGEPSLRNINEPSSRNIDGEPSLRNIDEPSLRSIDGEPSSRNIDGEPSSRNIDGEPSFRNIDEPSSRSIDGEPSLRNIDEPSSRSINGEPSSRSMYGEPSSRNIHREPSLRNIKEEPSSRITIEESSSPILHEESSLRTKEESFEDFEAAESGMESLRVDSSSENVTGVEESSTGKIRPDENDNETEEEFIDRESVNSRSAMPAGESKSPIDEDEPTKVPENERSREEKSPRQPVVLLTRLNDPFRVTRRRDRYRNWDLKLTAITESNNEKISSRLAEDTNEQPEVIAEETTDERSAENTQVSEEMPNTQRLDEETCASTPDKMNCQNESAREDKVVFLKPGKSWARSLSILSQVHCQGDLESLAAGKGRKWRESVQSLLGMQKQGQLQSCVRKNEDCNKLPSYSGVRNSLAWIPGSSQPDTSGLFSIGSPARFIRRVSIRVLPDRKSFRQVKDTSFLEAYGIGPPETQETNAQSCTPLVPEKCLDIVRTPVSSKYRDVVLAQCGQDVESPFEKSYPEEFLENCRKIGEGVYGEVFLYEKDSAKSVIKIIPIEGETRINGERQKKFDEILSEIVIAKQLHNLRFESASKTSNFVEVKNVRCVVGKYPPKLIDLWAKFDEDKSSENDCPSIFEEDQLYIVLELGHGGEDLEAYVFQNAGEAHALFMQAAVALAVAEETLEFEHRDLHWGNLLISRTDESHIDFRLNDKPISLTTKGVRASVIDFTLSRMSYEGCSIFNDLSMDEDLFVAQGEYQFDVYRLMRKKLENDWQRFEPYTNVLWLHYLLDKMITDVRYRRKNTKVHKSGIAKLEELKNDILEYKSSTDFVTSCDKATRPRTSRTSVANVVSS